MKFNTNRYLQYVVGYIVAADTDEALDVLTQYNMKLGQIKSRIPCTFGAYK